jgi:hypothetical protein
MFGRFKRDRFSAETDDVIAGRGEGWAARPAPRGHLTRSGRQGSWASRLTGGRFGGPPYGRTGRPLAPRVDRQRILAEQEMFAEWRYCDAYDSRRRLLGVVDNVFADDYTGEPTWVAIVAPSLGRTFAPLAGMKVTRKGLRFAFDEHTIWNAPAVGSELHLSLGEDQGLRDYYGLGPSPVRTEVARRL